MLGGDLVTDVQQSMDDGRDLVGDELDHCVRGIASAVVDTARGGERVKRFLLVIHGSGAVAHDHCSLSQERCHDQPIKMIYGHNWDDDQL